MNDTSNTKERKRPETFTDFLFWINTDINPKRINSGLKEISQDEALKCFVILLEFDKSFNKK